jgi:hypothetical protein
MQRSRKNEKGKIYEFMINHLFRFAFHKSLVNLKKTAKKVLQKLLETENKEIMIFVICPLKFMILVINLKQDNKIIRQKILILLHHAKLLLSFLIYPISY